MFNNKHKNEKKDTIYRLMRSVSYPSQGLSRVVDLRKWMPPIDNQYEMNTCSAHALAGVCEYFIRRYLGRHIDVSRLFIYYNGQIIHQKTHQVQDSGVNQRNIVLALRKYGICEEKFWPYKRDLLNVEPSIKAYKEASRYTVIPLRIPFNIKAIEICLHNKIPIIIDIKLIDQTGRSIKDNHGYLTMPDLNNNSIDKKDFHTVLIVGYDRNIKHFIVRNSYGRNWGYRGYFYMPYEYLSDNRLVNSFDGLWTITQIIQRTDKLPTLLHLVLTDDEKH